MRELKLQDIGIDANKGEGSVKQENLFKKNLFIKIGNPKNNLSSLEYFLI